MPELRLLALDDVLGAADIKKIQQELTELEADALPEGDDYEAIDEVLSENQLTDFMDLLDAQDMACSIYLPVEFDAQIEVESHTVGSVFSLLEALEDLREEMALEEELEEAPGDDEELELEVIEEQLAYAWRTFFRAATRSVDQKVPLHVLD